MEPAQRARQQTGDRGKTTVTEMTTTMMMMMMNMMVTVGLTVSWPAGEVVAEAWLLQRLAVLAAGCR